jgi:hypothetical protein
MENVGLQDTNYLQWEPTRLKYKNIYSYQHTEWFRKHMDSGSQEGHSGKYLSFACITFDEPERLTLVTIWLDLVSQAQ